MRTPNIIHVDHITYSNTVKIDGRWHLARPKSYGSIKRRVKATWMVLTGRADALIWTKQ